MNPIILSTQTDSGELYQATFLQDKGMNLISFKKGSQEVIDQSTLPLFEERFAGLGALIGPHFHRRKIAALPKISNEALFPHIARLNEGVDPFSHGIARYAPWQATFTETSIKARLTGKDLWNGLTLTSLEGQNFIINFEANLTTKGLEIVLNIVSDTDSLVGIHYYYHLPKKEGSITSFVSTEYIENGEIKKIPPSWNINKERLLNLDLKEELDCTLYPFPDKLGASILLDAKDYKLKTTYQSPSQENSWQLYHPKNSSFVCIEPISSQDPRNPNLSVSSLKILLEINP